MPDGPGSFHASGSLPTAEQQLPTVQPMDSLLGPDAPPIVVHQPPSDQELACALPMWPGHFSAENDSFYVSG
jgi:hypothetical protein